MFFGGGGIPFGMDDGMGGGMPGMGGMGGGRQREAADTTALYEVLGVQKKATQSEIKKAFRKKALKTHPDKGGDVEEFKKLQAAYEVLGDEEKRAKYDQYGLEGAAAASGRPRTRCTPSRCPWKICTTARPRSWPLRETS